MRVDLLRDGLLRAPAAPAASELAAPAPPQDALAKTCELCHERPGSMRCVHCQRTACPQDYWIMFGLCRSCLSEEEMARAREGRVHARPDLGIKWVDD